VQGGVAEAGGLAGCWPDPWGCQDSLFAQGRAFALSNAAFSTPVKHENRLGALICLVYLVYLVGLD